MEAGSEGEKKQQLEGENRTKRKMKTASQLEMLEKTYAEDAYPLESLRAELSAKVGLSDRQLQMWFCHRRMKDRKGPPAKLSQNDSHAGVTGGIGGYMVVNEHTSVLDLGPSAFGKALGTCCGVLPPTMAVPRFRGDMSIMNWYSEPQQSIAELRATAFVEVQLGEPIREDGPLLGMEFDPLPPGAFGTPIGAAMVGQQRPSKRFFDAKIYKWADAKGTALHEYQFIPERPTVRNDTYERLPFSYHHGSPADVPFVGTLSSLTGHSFLQGKQSRPLASALGKHDRVQYRDYSTNISMDAHFTSQYINKHENSFAVSDDRVSHVEDVQIERKRKSDEARIARELEVHENKIRKDLEKQDMLRQKGEEQIHKEMERHYREWQKEEERVIREKQREEERLLREQRREQERREKLLQKESLRAEKMRQKEELHREKEAARTKAASERAIARQNAKESIELIEDERLELMELAASSKGFPSILSLDYDTLQNIELYRDMQPAFPPEIVQLKRPFSIQPWTDSEENVGSLLMAWRFLISFADVLGLWSFTLDEFVQAFHDYDPRLLSEIHISLLSCIIKDIEDVARATSTRLGACQNSSVNPGGGHAHIVEGAYGWGFDIRNWKHHLNPLTWPEILRQFALSAGFGPQLKKRSIELAYLHDEQGNDGEDVISNLRNGAAVENAVSVMQERGLSNTRRSRHLLTPGTVKYAAFHVLSLEGSKGLTVIEVADRIQKSGLRDLTTSKTPEASISAALSRDSKLFERTAPSTYRVRAPYRKDSDDGDALLSAAREKIRIFKSGSLDGEDADDVERDEESESDGAEDPEVDDLGTEIKGVPFSQKTNKFKTKGLSDDGNDSIQVIVIPHSDFQNSGVSPVHSEDYDKMKDIGSSFGQSADGAQICKNLSNFGKEDTDMDDNNPGEPWVRGLTEGEYSVLSVEERLSALVALIGIAVEGNSIRLVLEERLEAATAFKKQMWAEMQLDKRRMKEDYVTRMHCLMGNKLDHNFTKSSTEDTGRPFLSVAEKNSEMAARLSVQEECLSNPLNEPTNVHGFKSEGDVRIQDKFVLENHKFHSFQQPGYAADRSRSGLKSYIGLKAEEMYVYRSLPLGQDRRRNRYWQFVTSASQNDPGCGRIFVELNDGRWRLIQSEEGFDALLTYLDTRGVRESHLHTMLQRIEVSFKKSIRRNMLQANTRRQSKRTLKTESVQVMSCLDCSLGIHSPSSTTCVAESDISETSTSFVIELGKNETEKLGAIKRYRDLEKWMWKEFFSSSSLAASNYGRKRRKQLLEFCDYCYGSYSSKDGHCPCHRTSSNSESSITFAKRVTQCREKLKVDQHCTLDGLSSFPMRIRLLKMLLALTEVSIPAEALQYFSMEGCREPWGTKLNSSSSAADLLQVLTFLENAIKRDWLSSIFETTNELMDASNSKKCVAIGPSGLETVITLPWIPPTTAAVALRLMEFDAAISYRLHQEVESSVEEGSGYSLKLSSGVKDLSGAETLGTPYQAGCLKEDDCVELDAIFTTCGRARRIRQGLGPTCSRQQRASGSRNKCGKRSIVANKGLNQIHKWKRQPRGRGCLGGRQSIRNRQKLLKNMGKVGKVKNTSEHNIFENSLERIRNDDEDVALPIQHAARNSDRSYYDDENYQASGHEYEVIMTDDTVGF